MLKIDQLSLIIDDQKILDRIELELESGEIGCLLGPSGCGKTTTLRLIAGFLKPSQGAIHLDGDLVVEAKGNKLTQFVPSEKRGLGMLFQDFALFPHLNVYDNIAFGVHHLSRKDQKIRIAKYLALTQLEPFENRKIWELSGGQQQRLALAPVSYTHLTLPTTPYV